MSSKIAATLFDPKRLPRLLQAVRSALFPDNALAAARQTPTSAEIAEIKRGCARAIVGNIPPYISNRYFATNDESVILQDVENTLDLFADSYINRHLVIGITELLVVRLFPELGENGLDDVGLAD